MLISYGPEQADVNRSEVEEGAEDLGKVRPLLRACYFRILRPDGEVSSKPTPPSSLNELLHSRPRITPLFSVSPKTCRSNAPPKFS